MSARTPYERAADRVNGDPTLAQDADLLLWPTHEDHYDWLASAPIESVLHWLAVVKADAVG